MWFRWITTFASFRCNCWLQQHPTWSNSSFTKRRVDAAIHHYSQETLQLHFQVNENLTFFSSPNYFWRVRISALPLYMFSLLKKIHTKFSSVFALEHGTRKMSTCFHFPTFFLTLEKHLKNLCKAKWLAYSSGETKAVAKNETAVANQSNLV